MAVEAPGAGSIFARSWRASSSESGDGSGGEGKDTLPDFITLDGEAARAKDGSGKSKDDGGDGGGAGTAVGFEGVPSSTLLFPLYRRPVAPGIVTPISITSIKFVEVLNKVVEKGDKHVGLFLVKDREAAEAAAKGNELSLSSAMSVSNSRYNVTDIESVHKVGILARIVRIDPSPMGAHVLLAGRSRIEITSPKEVDKKNGHSFVNIKALRDKEYDQRNDSVRAHAVEIVTTLREMLALNPMFKEQLQTLVDQVDIANPSELADFAAWLTTSDAEELQAVLEELDVEARLAKSLTLLKAELELTKLQKQIQTSLEEKISKNQRKYFLNEQLKTIKKELGLETDEKEALAEKFRSRLEKLRVPPHAASVIDDEMAKLATLEPSSSEYNVTRNYLDWLTQLPWGVSAEENLDLKRATVVLDNDHYGLKDIKERILEFIAVGALKGTVQGKILCFVGPPGVGKTSIGKSIANSLNRKFFRFSVGGMTDVAEIKGHRKTYVGAMAGKLIQALKTTATSNPVIMIDEIDKMGRGWQGDPSSALLEALDPEQNDAFLDHYVDIPYDMSKVLFVCTANSLDSIPGPLLDRMEVLRLSGYVLQEKVAIVQKYLIKQAYKTSGLPHGTVDFTDDAIKALIADYCREAGVRNLQKHVEKIFRKIAFKILSDKPELAGLIEAKAKAEAEAADAAAAEASAKAPVEPEPAAAEAEDEADERFTWKELVDEPIVVSPETLEEYVGKPVYQPDNFYGDAAPPGVVMGLAWTSLGGATLYIETSAFSTKKADFKITGSMGDVMKESTKIAQSYATQVLAKLDPDNMFMEEYGVHMHIPEGATPKDGPSAGITMVTSLLSAAFNKPVAADLAMTGEISLTGKVLPIGGVKEKALAARRSGVSNIIFPKANEKDWDELDDYVKEGLTAHFATDYEQVYALAFPDGVATWPGASSA
ncbi:ATP-dependent protease La [Thecamonas trahens ATCC 50062]|uniref:Lon protease homolog n=1 Tax=Thecamonas trahens ATCC 50062 TaxID=461836 RepID=A0A0L0DKK6_THETB|nr:ATP-dependent protease La [Thecamonas trahens ATCC 50062]KNC52765.1 ATP-dependent protease La [Thecamonas trahens ATCC 50062]|eukprot:XP_013755077.1 ATP-dependent protease La [Thecamonas trahens ATCC 50062]